MRAARMIDTEEMKGRRREEREFRLSKHPNILTRLHRARATTSSRRMRRLQTTSMIINATLREGVIM